jgi:hypothetical protein
VAYVYPEIYGDNAPQIFRCPIGVDGPTCSSLAPANNPQAAAFTAPNSIAVSTDYLFWSDYKNNLVSRLSLANSSVSTVASNVGSPVGLAVDPSYVYWVAVGQNATFSIGRTLQANTDPSNVQAVVPQVSKSSGSDPATPIPIATDGANVYFGGNFQATPGQYASVGYAPVGGLAAGAAPGVLYSGGSSGSVSSIVAAAGSIFWLDTNNKTIYGLRFP